MARGAVHLILKLYCLFFFLSLNDSFDLSPAQEKLTDRAASNSKATERVIEGDGDGI